MFIERKCKQTSVNLAEPLLLLNYFLFKGAKTSKSGKGSEKN